MSIYFSAFYCPKLVIFLFTSLCTIKMKAYYIFTQIFVYILIKIDPTPYSIYNDISSVLHTRRKGDIRFAYPKFHK